MAGRVRIFFEKLFIRGAFFQLLVVGAIILCISAVGGVLAWLIRPDEFSFFEALWWAFLRLSDPGYLGDDQGTFLRIISTMITVLGYVLFLGALVAIMTQWLHATMRDLELGLTDYSGRDHIVILGWSNRTPVIIHQLLLARAKVKRFLRRHRATRLRIVVLAERGGPTLMHEIKTRVEDLWSPRKIILRSGSSLRQDNLERVDVQHAASIVIPSTDFTGSLPELADTGTIKTLRGLNHQIRNIQDPYEVPLVVAEIRDVRNNPVADRSYKGPIELIASDELLSRIMAQNVRHPALSSVYTELFTYRKGNEIYIRGDDRFTGKTISELATTLPRGILIGFVREEGGDIVPHLNVPSDTTLLEGDKLVVVAENFDNSEPFPSPIQDAVVRSQSLPPKSDIRREHRILVLGWNRKVLALIDEFSTYKHEQFDLIIASRVSVQQRLSLIEEFAPRTSGVNVEHVEVDYSLLSQLSALTPDSFNTIVMVASDWLESGEESDARTITASLLLEQLFETASKKPEVVLELSMPENAELLPEEFAEIIISPEIISYALTQVALRREMNAVYEELFTAGGAEVTFLPPSHYGLIPNSSIPSQSSSSPSSSAAATASSVPISFAQIESIVASYGHTALGIKSKKGGIIINPSRQRQFALTEDDEFIVIVSYEK